MIVGQVEESGWNALLYPTQLLESGGHFGLKLGFVCPLDMKLFYVRAENQRVLIFLSLPHILPSK